MAEFEGGLAEMAGGARVRVGKGVRWIVAGAVSSMVALVFTGVVPSGAEPAGVQFVATEPVVLSGAPVKVELFNGSPTAQSLNLYALGEGEALLTISAPAPSNMAAAGVRASFTVAAKPEAPPQPKDLTVQLLATSSDGTLARQSLRIKGSQAAVPEPSPATKLSLRGTNFVPTPVMQASQLWRVTDDTVRGQDTAKRDVELGKTFVAGNNGRIGVVSIEEGKVTVESITAAGTYEGKRKDGDTTQDITLKVRDVWWYALAVLFIGILVAGKMEHYLTRGRPARHLDYILATMKTRVREAQQEAGTKLDALRQATPPVSFSPDLIYQEPEPSARGYLAARAKELRERLTGAKADFEAERFGPASDAVKELEAKVEQFLEHLRTTHSAARIALSLADEHMDSPAHDSFVTAVSGVLTRHLLETANDLEGRKTEVKALLSRLEEVHDLDDRLRTLIEVAADGSQHEQTAKELRRFLLARVDLSAAADVKGLRTDIDELAKQIASGTSSPAKKARARAAAPAIESYPDVILGRSTSYGDDLLATEALVLPDVEFRDRLERSDREFTIGTGIFVALSGMAALYLNNETFGSTLDYAGVLLWGTSAQQGLNLVRRLLPGALKNLG